MPSHRIWQLVGSGPTTLTSTAPGFVELAVNAVGGAVEEIDRRPEQVFEIGLEPGIAECRDERVEYIGDGAADDVGRGQ